jgi:DNA-binding transcriptional regulator/RsmH inhibitor MraZ
MPDTAHTNDTPVFMRDYRNTVDAQWRVTVPAAWRFAERAELYIRVKSDHLVVLPRAEVERFRQWARTLSGPDRTAALTEWGRTTDQTKIDSAGRITLPGDWATQVGIDKSSKVVLVGATEHFQIWSEARHTADETGLQKRGKALLAQYD